jgi:hypothetical protein
MANLSGLIRESLAGKSLSVRGACENAMSATTLKHYDITGHSQVTRDTMFGGRRAAAPVVEQTPTPRGPGSSA